jgi:hypothetical protein
VKHAASPTFWRAYEKLPNRIKGAADEAFMLLKRDPSHPSLRFKKIAGAIWSARVTLSYRALARETPDGYVWFWIGSHADYDRLLKG